MRITSKHTRVLWASTLMLGACAGAGATGATGGQPAPASSAVREGLQPPRVYEVPLDRSGLPAEVDPGFIEVNGQASVEVPADVARITFAVETRAVTAADAAALNADLMDAVLRNVRAGSFRGLQLETFGYSLRPEYTFSEDRARTVDGYTALNNVRASVGDVAVVGRVIDAAVAAGANRITSISFEASDTEAARQEALAMAVRQARAQALTLAEALGYELGEALEVRGGADRPMPRPVEMDMMLMRAEAAPTPIEAGDRTVTANVSVRFALGARRPG